MRDINTAIEAPQTSGQWFICCRESEESRANSCFIRAAWSGLQPAKAPKGPHLLILLRIRLSLNQIPD